MEEEISIKYLDSGHMEIYSQVEWRYEMVEMRDGMKLWTAICIPANENLKFPVVLQRTCYPNERKNYQCHGEHIAKRGYVYIVQFCRGIAQSEGEWEPNVNERQDGIDTVEWIHKQEWCDCIGVWGCSYLALTGWAMADAVEGKVTSMCLSHYGTDRFTSAYEKGMFRQDVLTSWAISNSKLDKTVDILESYRYMPQERVDVDLWGKEVPWYRDYVQNDKRTDEYWQAGWWKQLRDIPKKTTIPILVIGGWYDHHLGSTMVTWEQLNPIAKEKSWLKIGAWNHNFEPCIEGKKTEHIDNNEVKMMLDWFQITLKKKVIPEKKVDIYNIQEDSWITMKDWEREKRIIKRLYFNTETQRLQEKKTETKHFLQYVYNPDQPVMTNGSESCLYHFSENGSKLQKMEGYREDVLSFISEPLQEDLKIRGRIKINLHISSDCEDTCFTAKVMEVDEKNRAYNIRSGITTIEQGKIDGREYITNDICELTMTMWDICYTVRKGERIRVDISSSDFPNYHLHCNYKGVWGIQGEKRIAIQKIWSGKEIVSYMEMELL